MIFPPQYGSCHFSMDVNDTTVLPAWALTLTPALLPASA